MSQILYDHLGRVIPDPETRKVAEEKLKEYMQKHHSRFQDWFRENGMAKPPIFFDTKSKEWAWRD